jgi:hypothetical protein
MKNIKTFEEFAQANNDEETLGLSGEDIFVENPDSSIDPEDAYDDEDYIKGDEDDDDDDFSTEEKDKFDDELENSDNETDDETEDLEDDGAVEFDEKF